MRGIFVLLVGAVLGALGAAVYFSQNSGAVPADASATAQLLQIDELQNAREITRVRIGPNGIELICNPSADWSPRSDDGVIEDIQNGQFTYYVQVPIEVVVVNRDTGPYLRTRETNVRADNLGTRPRCDQFGNAVEPMPSSEAEEE